MFLGLFERALELFSFTDWRVYVASVVGRRGLRNPFGARRTILLPSQRPTLVAKNDSKARALLVNVQMFATVPTRFSQDPDIGTSSFSVDPSDPTVAEIGEIFVLRPEEQLFALSIGAQTLNVGQEWY